MEPLKRTQIYLAKEQLADLQAQARQSGRPMAELVREAVAQYLTAKKGRSSLRDDPINKLIGAFASDVSDAGVNHDHYLYGGPKKSKAEARKIYARVRGH